MIDYTTSEHFREQVMKRYPILEDNESYKNMFLYLLFPYYDPDDDRVIIPATLIASIEGLEWNTNYSAIAFLNEFKRDVLPAMQWYEYSKQAGKSRRIADFGWGTEFEELIHQERLGAFDDGNRVWFLSGNKITKQTVANARKERKTQAMNQLVENKAHDDMTFIATYMNNAPIDTFIKTIKLNMIAAKAAAADIVKSGHKPARDKEIQVFDRAMTILRALDTYPQDHYTAVEGGTSRLFAIKAGIQNLPRKVRKALTHGYIEADLTSAQTAINAMVWNVESVSTFLSNPQNKLWATIASDLGFDLTESTKEAIKKAFYTVQFGGQLSTVKAEFTKRMNKAGYESNAVSFVNHWIVKAMLEGRDRYIAKMINNNGAANYYGVWFSLNDYEVNTILSHIATSYEMALIRPVFDVACESNDFMVVLYQYDGFSIHIKDKSREKQVLNRLAKAVKTRATELNIHTTLEYEYV